MHHRFEALSILVRMKNIALVGKYSTQLCLELLTGPYNCGDSLQNPFRLGNPNTAAHFAVNNNHMYDT